MQHYQSSSNRVKTTLALLALFLALAAAPSRAAPPPDGIFSGMARFHPVTGKHGMVASQEAWATLQGKRILEKGGNAVDAAVTTAFTLAVTLPRAGNIGGGGFMLIHLAEEGRTVAIDFREMAPAAATRGMFLDAEGEVDSERSLHSHLSSGVPGSVAGLAHALEKYGTISLREALEPAIRTAREGIPVSRDLRASLLSARGRMAENEAAREVFYPDDGLPPPVGERLIQEDLANTLALIARDGPSAFYDGPIAELLIAEMERGGGLITRDDLRNYKVIEREPVRGTYRGFDILSMPPPSSGGVHLIQMLNTLEGYPLGNLGHNSAATIHLLAESARLAYADRSKHLGDPDFHPVPLQGLLSKDYADTLRSTIDRLAAKPSREVSPGKPHSFQESDETTHLSVVDAKGNAVAMTTTLNFSYGSKIMVSGAGFLLNDEMDDFSSKPGEPNAYGLLGGEANAIEPGKRMLSSMTPTLVLKDGEVYMVTGSPGGSRIITTVLQIVSNVIDHDMNIAEATAAPRVHHQWYPDEIRVERGLSPDTIRLLEEMGHKVALKTAMGSTQSILRQGGLWTGASDPRREGAAAGVSGAVGEADHWRSMKCRLVESQKKARPRCSGAGL